MTRRFIGEILTKSRPALSVLWQCEPDHSQHSHPLGSPQHLRAVAAADANVGRVVDALSPCDSECLVMIASDHGHETAREIIPIESILISAGFKKGTDSTDVVVVSNGLSASIYVAQTARVRVQAMIEFLEKDKRIDKVLSGRALEMVGHLADSPLAIALTGAQTDELNEFGIPGLANAFSTPLSSDTLVGCGQHGGLGNHEQHPFLLVAGEGFAPGTQYCEETSVVDIAPTILRHLRMSMDGMDGRALQSSRKSLQ